MARLKNYLNVDSNKAKKIVDFLKDRYPKVVKNNPTFNDICKILTSLAYKDFRVSFLPTDKETYSDQFPNGDIVVFIKKISYDDIEKVLTKELNIKRELHIKANKEALEDLPPKLMKEYFLYELEKLCRIISKEEKLLGSSKYYMFYMILFGEGSPTMSDVDKKVEYYNENDKTIDRWLELQSF